MSHVDIDMIELYESFNLGSELMVDLIEISMALVAKVLHSGAQITKTIIRPAIWEKIRDELIRPALGFGAMKSGIVNPG